MSTALTVTPHAVRWFLRHVGLEERYSKWHHTRDAFWTTCKVPIPVGRGERILPEADDDLDMVDCRRCLAQQAWW